MKASGLVAIACAAALTAACGGNGRDESMTAEVDRDQTVAQEQSAGQRQAGGHGETVGTAGTVNTGASGDAKHFAEQAAKHGAAEVAFGKLAAQRAASAEVKQFAQTMVRDHTKSGEELRQAATANGMQLMGELPDDSEKLMRELEALQGAAFDREYMEAMVEGHREMKAMVTRRVDDARLMTDNGALEMAINAWASKALPTIDQHLMMAERIEKTVNGDREDR